MEIRLCRLEDGDEKKWDEFVKQSPQSSFCHVSVWKHVIKKTYGHKVWYFWVIEHDKVRGMLTLISMKTVLFGRSLISLPFLDEGVICADDSVATTMLNAAARQLTETMGIKSLKLRHHAASPLPLSYHGNQGFGKSVPSYSLSR